MFILCVKSVDIGVEVLAQGDAGGEAAEQHAQQENADKDADNDLIVLDQGQLRHALAEAIDQQGECGISQQSAEEALQDAATDEGPADVGRRGTYELHAAHQESLGVDGEPYGVAYQCDGDDK